MNFEQYLHETWPVGSRNQYLFDAVMMARERQLPEQDIRDTLGAKARKAGLDDPEIAKTMESAFRRPLERTFTPTNQHTNGHGHTNGHQHKNGNGHGHPLSWNAALPNAAINDPATPTNPALTFPLPSAAPDWEHSDLSRFLEALFEPDEYVSYNVNAQVDTDKVVPKGYGINNRTAKNLLDSESDATTTLGAEPAIGAWVRLNPVDGKGIKDANVTAFRHVLVEFDAVSTHRQWQEMMRLRVPCTTVVHSGGKSLHFAVRVDATDKQEYKARADQLYKLLTKAGLQLDTKNKNASRLSRAPGVWRDGEKQYLVATHIGCGSWEDWLNFMDTAESQLPPIESLTDLFADPPPLAPELIGGILRRGHKLLISGHSKGGKTFTLIHLACCVSAGQPWLGHKCVRGKVLYINLEVDRPSFVKRVQQVSATTGVDTGNFDTWHLRGHPMRLDELVAVMIRILERGRYAMTIIDPAYKVITGDENNAKDMALFCAQLDVLSTKLGTAVVMASHFTKGHAGFKQSIDRASGSGVFGRDPDAIGTLTPMADEHGNEAVELEWTLREFPKPAPVALAWEFPIHKVDLTFQGKLVGAPGRMPASIPYADIEAAVLAVANPGERFAKKGAVATELGCSVTTLHRKIKEKAAQPAKLTQGYVYV